MKHKFVKPLLKLLLSCLIIGLFLFIIALILHYGLNIDFKDFKDRDKIQSYISSTGAFSYLVLFLIAFLQVTFIPIPGAIVIIVGNYLFGFWINLLLCYFGMLFASIFAFFLGRKIGKPFAYWVVGSKEKTEEYLKKLNGKETVILFFMYLLPFFPDDMLCVVAGLTPISYGKFILMQVITRFTSIIGTILFMSGEFIPYKGWGLIVMIILAIICIAIFILSYKNADKINAFLDRMGNKIKEKLVKK